MYEGDVLEILQDMEDEKYNAVFCDPPYGIRFMSRQWDHGVPSAKVWAEVLRVCKPGAVLMAFGGTRTWHRLAVNIEEAGWEMWDTIMWVYGSGFPKSHNISKAIDKAAGAEREVVRSQKLTGTARIKSTNGARTSAAHNGYSDSELRDSVPVTAPATDDARTWDGYGTALKPSWEPILCFRKPRTGTYAQHAVEDGTGALNIDGCRVPTEELAKPTGTSNPMGGVTIGKYNGGNQDFAGNGATNPNGRWPANLIWDGSEEVLEVFARAGESRSTNRPRHNNSTIGGNGKYNGGAAMVTGGHNDSGTAARFFQVCPKDHPDAARFFYAAKASRSERQQGLSDEMTNRHPCVKPLSLCEYLARLIVPPEKYRADARLLVPFAGSGSEIIGAIQAGWQNVDGIEIEPEYVEIARRRIEHWRNELAQIQPRLLIP